MTTRIRLLIRYVELGEVVLWDRNPKAHDIEGIKNSLRRYGMRKAPVFDRTIGMIVAGNGTAQALTEMEDAREMPPQGIDVDERGGWLMPIQVGVDGATSDEAEAYAVDDNNLTVPLTAVEVASIWGAGYPGLLHSLDDRFALPITITKDDLAAIAVARNAPRVSAQAPETHRRGLYIPIGPSLEHNWKKAAAMLDNPPPAVLLSALLERFLGGD